MLKLKNCKELNYFDNYNMLNDIDNKRINSLLQLINNTTCKLQFIYNKAYYYIIHRSTKTNNLIQCSYFKNNTTISDIERIDYKTILNEIDIKNLQLMEVIK